MVNTHLTCTDGVYICRIFSWGPGNLMLCQLCSAADSRRRYIKSFFFFFFFFFFADELFNKKWRSFRIPLSRCWFCMWKLGVAWLNDGLIMMSWSPTRLKLSRCFISKCFRFSMENRKHSGWVCPRLHGIQRLGCVYVCVCGGGGGGGRRRGGTYVFMENENNISTLKCLLQKCELLLQYKSYSHFSAENINEFAIFQLEGRNFNVTLANNFVKFWTSGPWFSTQVPINILRLNWHKLVHFNIS